ncbi:pyridoxal phosphate-dependent aminotransferase [soil metagenome]
MNIQSKFSAAGETIFTVMSALAQQYQSINLGQGFPDFAMDAKLIELVNEHMKQGHNQYVHMNGLMQLRETLAQKIKHLYNQTVSAAEEITITPGATYAIYTALTTLLQPGDEVIVFEPAYDSYIPNIEINRAVPVLIQLKYPDYKIDWDEVKRNITPKTKLIMINSPHNPTGSILSKEDIQQLHAVVEGTDIFILSDEVYEHLIFDNKEHESILKYPELYKRSFVTFSFGKVFHCTGWKTGYCVAPKELMTEFRKVHQFNSFTSNTPLQFAFADYLQDKSAYQDLAAFVQQKRDHFATLMQATKFTPLPSYGSYFQLYSYSNISDMPEKEFAIQLTKEQGVTTIPVSAFYKNGKDDKVLRFCFAKAESTLGAAAGSLALM